MEFLYTLDHTNGKIRRPNWPRRMESRAFNFRILRKCSRVPLPTSSIVVNRWSNFISPNENCSLSVAISRLFAPIEDEMWPRQAFCRWLIIHRLEGGRVKKKLKVDGKVDRNYSSQSSSRGFCHFPETTNVERISG